MDNTQLTFINSHLAAHQSKTLQRNNDAAEICCNLQLLLPAGKALSTAADLTTSAHHVVWMGDLNYRLEYGQQAHTHSDSPTPEDFSSLCLAVSSGRFSELLELDQLKREQAARRVFAGFEEGHIDFAPTFKVSC